MKKKKNQTIKNTSESDSSINNKYKDKIKFNTKNPKINQNAFNLSYIPLNLMC